MLTFLLDYMDRCHDTRKYDNDEAFVITEQYDRESLLNGNPAKKQPLHENACYSNHDFHCSKDVILRTDNITCTISQMMNGDNDTVAITKHPAYEDITTINAHNYNIVAFNAQPRSFNDNIKFKYDQESSIKFDHAISILNERESRVCRTLPFYKAKQIISCCTCYWCFSSIMYHCLYEDDMGYNDSRIFSCDDSCKRNVKKGCLFSCCLPFLPCLGIYACVDYIINLCMK